MLLVLASHSATTVNQQHLISHTLQVKNYTQTIIYTLLTCNTHRNSTKSCSPSQTKVTSRYKDSYSAKTYP